MKIGIILFQGFTDLDFFLPWDILNRVPALNPDIGWEIEILGDEQTYRSCFGIGVHPTKPYSYSEYCEGIYIVSGPNAKSLAHDTEFLELLRLDPKRQTIAAIDSGALLLAAKGIIVGEKATTYPNSMEQLRNMGAEVVSSPLVESGNIATGARCLSGTNLSQWLITRLAGEDVAKLVIETIAPLQPSKTNKKQGKIHTGSEDNLPDGFPIEIRRACREDIDFIVRLTNEDADGSPKKSLPDVLPDSYYEAFQEIDQSNRDRLMVATHHGSIVGTFHIKYLKFLAGGGQIDLQVEAVHVDPQYRSRGIGAQMMKWVMADAARLGCRRIQFTSNKDRFRAHKFYRDLGFEDTHFGFRKLF